MYSVCKKIKLSNTWVITHVRCQREPQITGALSVSSNQSRSSFLNRHIRRTKSVASRSFLMSYTSNAFVMHEQIAVGLLPKLGQTNPCTFPCFDCALSRFFFETFFLRCTLSSRHSPHPLCGIYCRIFSVSHSCLFQLLPRCTFSRFFFWTQSSLFLSRFCLQVFL